MNSFERLKEICRVACHERNACESGFKALMNAETIPQILTVWRQNWDDVYKSKFSDIMAANIVSVFEESRDIFHANEVYVNEPAEKGLLIISSPQQTVEVSGRAHAYLFTAAEVTARGNAQVYCRYNGAVVTLHDHAYGKFEAGTAHVYDFASANGMFQECHTYNAAQVTVNSGKVIDHGHRRITVYDGNVFSDHTRNIEIDGQTRLYPLSEYNNIKE